LGEKKKEHAKEEPGCVGTGDTTRRQVLKKLLYIPPLVTSLILSRDAAAQSTCHALCPGQCPPFCMPVCTPVCSPVCPHN